MGGTPWTCSLLEKNEHDFERYQQLYDPKFFKGIKRTASGDISVMEHAGWMKDRRRMFTQTPTVAAEDLEVTTWRDPEANLRPRIVSVRFTQKWRTDRYANHGPKVLTLFWSPSLGTRSPRRIWSSSSTAKVSSGGRPRRRPGMKRASGATSSRSRR